MWLGLVKAHLQTRIFIPMSACLLVDILTSHVDTLLVDLRKSALISAETMPTDLLVTSGSTLFVIFVNSRATHTHTRLMALCPGLPGWVGTREVKPISGFYWRKEMVSGSGISWAICNSAPRSRQITIPAPHHSVFYRPDALPATQPTVSKHWRHTIPAQAVMKLPNAVNVIFWY